MFSYPTQAPALDRSPQNGFRTAFYPSVKEIVDSVFEPTLLIASRDLSEDTPVANSVFEVYQEQFSYDRADLNESVEWRRESPGEWTHEKITYDAAYGDERIIAHLFLPENAAPPYQTVVYVPGGGSLFQPSSEDIHEYWEFPIFLSFIVKNGRAVLFPVYQGTFERRMAGLAPLVSGENSRRFVEFQIQLVKDFRRSLDFLESRPDIDPRKFAYYGMSWGASQGAIITAVESRLKVSVLLSGGIFPQPVRAEVDQVNYLARAEIPTLVLNGRYDSVYSLEESARPMFDLLGTPPEHKLLKLYDTDHIPPRNEFIREILAWFDKYLGPVKRAL